LVMGAKS